MKKIQKNAFTLIFVLFAALFAVHAETQGDDIFKNQEIEDGDFYKINREPSKKEIEDENSKLFENIKQKKLDILKKIERERQKLESSKSKLSSATEKSRLDLEKNKTRIKSQLSKNTEQAKTEQKAENSQSTQKSETGSLPKNTAALNSKQKENKSAANSATPEKSETKSAEKIQKKPLAQNAPAKEPETEKNATIEESEQKMDSIINLRKKFIDLGMGYKGTEYVWGGKTPKPGFDCSGLVSYTAKQSLGIDIKGNAQDIYNQTSPVSLGEALPGDLIFFKGAADIRITHVGIYLGKNPGENDFGKQNLFLNAASAGPRTGVIISGLNENYWKKTFYGCGRIIPEI